MAKRGDPFGNAAEDEKAFHEKRLNSFLEDCQRLGAGTGALATTPIKTLHSSQETPVTLPTNSLQHYGYVVLPGQADETKQLRIEVVMEPNGQKPNGNTFRMDIDIEVHK